MTSRKEITNTINTILSSNNCKTKIRDIDYCVGEKTVGDFAIVERRLSNTIFDFCFPKLNSGIYYHYTSYNKLKSILSNNEIRLYNLFKRFKSGEFRTFCIDHNLTGYVRQNDEGIFKDLMRELFYVSLVDKECFDDKDLWEKFGNKEEGVLLEFKIETNSNDFRKIYYQNNLSIPLLKELQKSIKDKFDLLFVPARISKMGGFYQRKEYAYQKECRLLFKKASDDYCFPFNSMNEKDNVQYIKIELGKKYNFDFLLKIDLLGIYIGRKMKTETVKKYLEKESLTNTMNLYEYVKQWELVNNV